VEPGELINARLDVVLGNDITAPVAIKEFEKLGIDRVFDKDRIMLVPDHFTPNKDIKSAEQAKILREFARKYEITNYFEVGQMGIEHCLLPEAGLVVPGDVIIGADSHTCTYGALGAFATGVGSTDMAAGMATGEAWFKVPESIKFEFYGDQLKPWVSGKDLILYTIGKIGVDGALYQAMEFTGEVIKRLSMDSRFTMANMAIEAGGKNGIIEADEITLAYVRERAKRPYQLYQSDPDAQYVQVYQFDVADIEPQVAFPHLPENTKPISKAGGVKIDQVVIGSCTNGRMEDLRVAAQILQGKKVSRDVRLIIIPGTQNIYLQAMKEGLVEIFINAGAVFSTPTCGPCLGGHMGILAKGERALATTNRNFVGRMGSPESEVYLSNPAVAAASAVTGYIVSPEEVLS
jgi:3-isopropylmalate/(R)-2-methylmalate dehydratase large subunit